MSNANEFPLEALPRGPEAGFVSVAVIGALMDLLVEKKVIGRGELVFMLQALSKRLSKETHSISKRSTDILGNWVHAQERLQEAHN